MKDEGRLYELVGEAMFAFMKERTPTFPNVTLFLKGRLLVLLPMEEGSFICVSDEVLVQDGRTG